MRLYRVPALAALLAVLCVPAHSASERDVLTLREYVDIRFEATAKAVDAALASSKEATAKAEGAMEKRFDNTNEWRQTVETLQRTYMPRTEAEQQIRALAAQVEDLTARANARDERRGGFSDVWVMIAAVIGVLGALTVILSRWFRPSVPAGSQGAPQKAP